MNQSADASFAGSIRGMGNVIKAGDGTLNLTGVSSVQRFASGTGTFMSTFKGWSAYGGQASAALRF